MSPLKEHYGHEEQLSAALATNAQLASILAEYGVTIDGKVDLEMPVKYGHDGHTEVI